MLPHDAPRSRWRRRFLRRTARVVAVLTVLLGGLYLVRNALLAPLVVRVARAVLTEEGDRLTIAGVSGGWLSDLELEGVELVRAPGSREVLAGLKDVNVRAEYSLLDLARGRIDGLHLLEVRGARVELFFGGEEEASAEGGPGTEPPASLPRVDVRLKELLVRDAGTDALRASGLELRVVAADPDGSSSMALSAELSGSRMQALDLAGPLDLGLHYAGGRVTSIEARVAGDVILSGEAAMAAGGALDFELALAVEGLAARGTAAGNLDAGVLEAELELQALVLDDLRERFPSLVPTELSGVVALSVEGTLPLADPLGAQASLTLNALPVRVAAIDLDSLTATARLEGGTLSILALDAFRGPDRLAAREFRVPLAAEGLRERLLAAQGRLTADVRDLAAFLPEREGAPLPPHAMHLEAAWAAGRAALDGSLETAGGTFRVQNGELVWGSDPNGGDARLALNLALDFEDVEELGRLFGRVDLGGSARGTLALDGPVRELSGALSLEGEGVRLADIELGTVQVLAGVQRGRVDVRLLELTSAELRGSMTGVWLPEEERVEDVELLVEATRGVPYLPEGLHVEGTTLRFSGSGTLEEPRGRLELQARGLSTGELEADELSLRADVDGRRLAVEELRLDNDDDSFVLAGTATLEVGVLEAEIERLRIERQGAHLELVRPASVRTAGGRLTVEDFECRREDGQGGFSLDVDVPYDPDEEGLFQAGPVKLELAAEFADLSPWSGGRIVAGTGVLAATLAGEWKALRGSARLDAEGIALAELADALGPCALEIELEIDERMRISRARFAAPKAGEISLSGELLAGLDLETLSGAGLASLAHEPLSLELVMRRLETAWIAEVSPAMRRLAGRVEGRLELEGSAAEPRFDGHLTLREGGLRLASDFPGMRELEADLYLEGDALRLERATGLLGASPFELSGTVDLAGEEPLFDLQFGGKGLLLRRTRDVNLRADAALAVSGPLRALHASGTVALTDGRYTRDLDFFNVAAGSESASPGGAGRRGLALTFWREPPLSNMTFDVSVTTSSPFRIRNNVVEGSLRPEVRLTGTGEVPILLGQVFIDPSTVVLPAGRLQVRSGSLSFLKGQPFLPTIDLAGSIRIRGIDVEVRLSGPYDAPEIALSSTPALPREELLYLFLTGQSREASGAIDAAQSVAVYLTQDAVSRWLSGEDEGVDLFLERLEVESGTEISYIGVQSFQATYLLEGRPLGEGYTPYLRAERDVWDRINFGFGFLFRFR